MTSHLQRRPHAFPACDGEPGDGSGCANCKATGTTKSCRFYRKYVQPLAFNLLGGVGVLSQESSPLFSVLPRELRDIIYEYALTDENNHPNQDQPVRRAQSYSVADLPKPSIAFNLLLTCRAVYLEAYWLPYILNPVIIYDIQYSPESDITRPSISRLAPWQFALVQSLEISMQQTQLEGSAFGKYAEFYKAAERHQGAIVLAQYFDREQLQASNAIPAFNIFGLKLKNEAVLPHISRSASIPGTYFDKVATNPQPTTAYPLTKLAIRLSRTDWWTWTDAPISTRSQLGLEPSLGDGSVDTRPTTALMLQLAEARRQGRWGGYPKGPCWGNEVAKFQSLKEFKLILETFAAKKSQLDTVVESAKTWTFPMGEHHELKFAGGVESSKWKESKLPKKIGRSQNIGYLSGRVPWRGLHDVQVIGGQAIGSDSKLPEPDPNEFEVRVIKWKRVLK
ncbi:hypothetical protein AOQ84DRAFT_439882 [Glonium stellatum]|uniref:Uncharacterized protein n=1 Tax=Glonium stellatum TaxID=574774 RepID=A0A8E2JSP2_9PEZI|nr:hypothetical protein AOQ84DRAFT_439882 [Glonium stellatum]